MMHCVKCGCELPEGAVFCPNCGERAAGGAREADSGAPLYTSEVKGLLKSGRLAVYRDRVEFSSSSAQRTVFNYNSLIAVKKRLLPTPAILFITEDARTEACAATSKNIHEAFLHIEQALQPYLEQRRARLAAQGIRFSLPSSMGMTNTGILNLSSGQAEFLSKSGRVETVPYGDVKSAALSAAGLELTLFDGGVRSFTLDKESREEVLAFVRESLAPFLEQRKADLLARGIYHSCLSTMGPERGTLDLYQDRAEFTSQTGQAVSIPFQTVRAADLRVDLLDLHLVDGTTRSFSVDRDEQVDILAFVKKAIEPYVLLRTEGFEVSFGSAERIEINEARGVFHILRQNGAVITDECPLAGLTACRLEESTALNALISGIRSGGKAIASGMGGKRAGETAEEEQVRSVDILLTVREADGQRTEALRFGDFPIGVSRTSPKYAQSFAEAAGLMEFLREHCPGCERVLPAPPELPAAAEAPGDRALPATSGAGGDLPAPRSAHASSPAREQNAAGIRKYIDRIAQYISSCQTPMTIAFQGCSGSIEGHMMKLLSDSLDEQCRGSQIWLHTRQLSRSDLGANLPMFLGATLVSQLAGSNDDRVVKFAKGFINLSVSMLSQGKSDGQFVVDAFFREHPTNSAADLVQTFAELVRKRTGGGHGKVVVLMDGLDTLAPGKMVEVLEAMEDFFACEGCVFVVAVEYASVVRGVNERYGGGEEQGKQFFNRTFRVPFRLPASDLQMESYVRSRLERVGLDSAGPEEVKRYCQILSCSIGSGMESVGHLFDSFELLKTLSDEDLYQRETSRLILFCLLCMQTRFPAVYDRLARQRGEITPEFLAALCAPEPDAALLEELSEEDRAAFQEFAQVLRDIIDTDGTGRISSLEAGIFARVLEATAITSV